MLTGDSHHHAARSPLAPAEFNELCALALLQWDAGGAIHALVVIRERGTERQYEQTVRMICAHDDAVYDRSTERQVQRLRAERAD